MRDNFDTKNLDIAVERFDLESYVHQTFDPVVPARDGEELRINCFAPDGCNGSDTKQHLYVNFGTKRWLCFKCGYGNPDLYKRSSSLARFIADAEGITIFEAIQLILDQVKPTPEEDLSDALHKLFDPPEKKEILPTVPVFIPKSFFPLKDSSYPSLSFSKYLRLRGLDDSDIRKYDVRYCLSNENKKWAGRVIFPIYDLKGDCLSLVGRSISDKRGRWENWKSGDLSSVLWPMGCLNENGRWKPYKFSDHVVITEGIFDCLAVLKLANLQAVCTFGKKISNKQIHLLRTLGVQSVTLAWDKDAKSKIFRLSRVLGSRFVVSVFPFKSPVWNSSDFGDVLQKKSPQMISSLIDELKNPISYDSLNILPWIVS